MLTVKRGHIATRTLPGLVETRGGTCLTIKADSRVFEIENRLIMPKLLVFEELIEIEYGRKGNVFGLQALQQFFCSPLAHGGLNLLTEGDIVLSHCTLLSACEA